MIGVVVTADRPEAVEVARRLVSLTDEAGLRVAACDASTAYALGVPAVGRELSVVVAVGGDGTVLSGVRHAIDRKVPVVGVNVGRVGFLAEVEPSALEELVHRLAGPTPPTVPRMAVAATVDGTTTVGLNDVVIQKTEGQHMVGVDVLVDGERFLTFRADGVIVSTPTGSSAYNLSAGGPLLDPRVDALVVTPVAPYSLFRSAVALDPDSAIRCTVIHDRSASVAVDGREVGVLAPGESVEIRRGPSVPFVDLAGRSYPESLKRKLRLHEGLDGVLGDPRI